ncbi:MAG: hypothetical protein ACLRMZ_25030 [Blautia marasmi]
MNRQRWKKYGFMAEVIVLTLTAALCWKDVSQGAFAAGHGAEQAENNSSSESAEDSGTAAEGILAPIVRRIPTRAAEEFRYGQCRGFRHGQWRRFRYG